ncbi:MAG: 50S ribosomal protein L3 [Sulfolobales archaeon]|nr:50S ribosomal protein L3 [Sulfolobales archaeon]MCX8186378.1 50S ribosomal protein L3 [Sulfolobales archaeon]MDW7968887.1 50S ribosomal protein L3 [Sulfolobales archaeon]
MARRKTSAPRRGSLAFRPRKRASRLVPRVRTWPELSLETPKLLAFVGYKVGMTHALMIDDSPNSLTSGREVVVPVTVLETPPVIPVALRAYRDLGMWGSRTFCECWIEPPKDLELWRKIPNLKVGGDLDKKVSLINENINLINSISVIVATQPKLTGGLSKKKPDILEVRVGGNNITTQLSYATSILGKELRVSDVFTEGQFIDIIGVTKGKGFQGVIKRFGVKELPKWHKHRKGSRRIGSRSPTMGALSTVPQAGQLGFHRRTEFNKRIIKIGSNWYEVVPSGGFPHYGIVRSDYILIEGSVMGAPKRPLVLRQPVRPPKWIPSSAPVLTYISLDSKV